MMKRKIILPLLSTISIAALTQGCTVWSDSADNVSVLFAKSDKGWLTLSDYDRGKHYVAVGDYGLAIDAFNAALAKDAKSVRAMNGLAIAYDRIGRGDVAQNLLTKALELDPRSVDTLNNLAYLHLSHGEKDEAALYFSRAKQVLASAAPDQSSARLETVLANNSALLSAEIGTGSPVPPATTVAVEQPVAQTAIPEVRNVELGRSQPAPIQPPSPSAPVANTGAAAAGQPASQVVASEIWDLQIDGGTPKLIPPSAHTARAVVPAASQPAAVKVASAPQSHLREEVKSVPVEPARPSPAKALPAVAHHEAGTAKFVATLVSTFGFQHHVTVRIANGTGRRNMAHRFQHYFGALGVPVRHLVNVSADCRQSTIYYSHGQEKAADALAQLLPVPVRTIGLSNGYGVVELMLAPDLEGFDRTLIERRAS